MTDTNPYFFQLIVGLQSSAWVMLGKVANPMTGKIEKNLEAARATIDTLAMLKEKTKGNLSEDEEKIVVNSLTELQLNYVEEKTKGAEDKKKVSGNEQRDNKA